MQFELGSITVHPIVLCVEKRERALGAESSLRASGFRVSVVTSIYEAMRVIEQEMPHLIVTEPKLEDGSAGVLFDKLQQNELLRPIPIMLRVVKMSREELTPLVQRKFAVFYPGGLDDKAFVDKLKSQLDRQGSRSPFFVGAEELSISEGLGLRVEVAMLGRLGEFVVVRSGIEVDPLAVMNCAIKGSAQPPAPLKMAINIRSGEDVLNLFPLRGTIGASRSWLLKLPVLSAVEDACRRVGRKLICFEPHDGRFAELRSVLTGYGFDLAQARSVIEAITLARTPDDSIAAVFCHETVNEAQVNEIKQAAAKSPVLQRLPFIMSFKMSEQKHGDQIRLLRKPYGLGTLLDALEAATYRPADFAAAGYQPGSTQGSAASFELNGRLVGCDETGIILATSAPLPKGTKLILGNETLKALAQNVNAMQVATCARVRGSGNEWYTRIDLVGPGMSKAKSWERVLKNLASVRKVAPAS